MLFRSAPPHPPSSSSSSPFASFVSLSWPAAGPITGDSRRVRASRFGDSDAYFSTMADFLVAHAANLPRIEALEAHMSRMSAAARSAFCNRQGIGQILINDWGLHKAFVPYFATASGRAKTAEISNLISQGRVRGIKIDMLHMMVAPGDLSSSLTEIANGAMLAGTNDATHAGRLVLLAEAFPCLLREKTLGAADHVRKCKALISIGLLFQAAALAPLTAQLQAAGGYSGLHMTETVLAAMPPRTQVALEESLSLALRYDWHTMALAISEHRRLFEKMAFVHDVSPEEAESILAAANSRFDVNRIRSEGRQLGIEVQQRKATLATELGVSADNTLVATMPPSVVSELLRLEPTAMQAAAQAWRREKFERNSAANRIYSMPPVPAGHSWSRCRTANCIGTYAGRAPTVDSNDRTLNLLATCAVCRVRHILLMNREDRIFMDFYKLCMRLRGLRVRDPPPPVSTAEPGAAMARFSGV